MNHLICVIRTVGIIDSSLAAHHTNIDLSCERATESKCFYLLVGAADSYS